MDWSVRFWKSLQRNAEWLLAFLFVVGNALILFLFLYDIPFPVGDDPGLHTTLIGELLRNGTTNFEIPIFPQVHAPFPDRSVTALLGWAVGLLTGIGNPFLIAIGLAAGLFALSTLLLFWFATQVSGRPLAGAVAAIFWSWVHWGQELFWEGNYDQITSLPIFFLSLIALWSWWRKPRWFPGAIVFLSLLALFRLHQLSFFAALAVGVTTLLLQLKTRLRWFRWSLAVATTIVALGLAIRVIHPYFLPSTDGYPLPILLTVAEGVHPIIPALVFVGLGGLFFRYSTVLFPFIFIPILLSQAGLVGVSFYPFRFNVYAMAAVGLLLALGMSTVFHLVNRRGAFLPLLLFLSLILIATPIQYTYSTHYRRYLTQEQTAPASILLQADYDAFLWIKENIAGEANFAAPFKWGYYLPAVTGKKVTLDTAVGGDERDNRYPYAQKVRQIFGPISAQGAVELAGELRITHIFEDASFARYPDRYKGYTTEKFTDTRYFQLLYHEDGVKIYVIR